MNISTYQKILEAATELFVAKGFSGTSIGDIARQAGINNQSLIYHHFGDKKTLWREVKKFLISKNFSENQHQEAHSTLEQFLESIIQERLHLYDGDPRVLRLVQWQSLEEETEDLIGGNTIVPLRWIERLEDLQKREKVRTDIPASWIALSLYHNINSMIRDNFERFIKESSQRVAYIECIKNMVVKFYEVAS